MYVSVRWDWRRQRRWWWWWASWVICMYVLLMFAMANVYFIEISVLYSSFTFSSSLPLSLNFWCRLRRYCIVCLALRFSEGKKTSKYLRWNSRRFITIFTWNHFSTYAVDSSVSAFTGFDLKSHPHAITMDKKMTMKRSCYCCFVNRVVRLVDAFWICYFKNVSVLSL